MAKHLPGISLIVIVAFVGLALTRGSRDEGEAATPSREPTTARAAPPRPSPTPPAADRTPAPAEADQSPTTVKAERTPAPAAAESTATPTRATPRTPQRLALPRKGSAIVGVRGSERVALRDSPGGERVTTLKPHTEFGSPTVLSVIRHNDGWAGVPTPELPNGKLGWVKLDPKRLRAGSVDLSIEVDLSERRARLLRGDDVLRSWMVSIGAEGAETPTGRFAVTDTFRGGLHPAYGCCALALTATQPKISSGWPGGDRIAIHGTGGPLGFAVSHGCIRSADADVSALVRKAPVGTPVKIHA